MQVFTYGTLMYPQVWQAVVGRTHESAHGRAGGYAIYRVRDAVFPGIVAADDGASVPGVVYLDVDEAGLARLDRFEDDFYRRELVIVRCNDDTVRDAFAYVVPEENRHVLTDEIWNADEFLARGDLDQFLARFAGFGRVADLGGATQDET